jgi:hypothetical protein
MIKWKNSNKLFEFITNDLTIAAGNYTITYVGHTGNEFSPNTFVLELTNPCPQEDFVLTKLEFEKTYVIGTK